MRVVAQGIGRSRVSLATAKDLPNRDLVLDVRTAETLDGVLAGIGSDGRGHFVAVVPSAAFKGEAKEGETDEPRRVVFVLDRSGSMGGAPIEQARKAVTACLGALGAEDRFGIVVFDDTIEAFGSGLVKATVGNRDKARKFLEGVDARGGTELASGVRAAADMLNKSATGGGGDVMVVTDGQVMGTESILGVARASGLRLHCLGIGSASQDRFLTLLARETGGVSRFVTPRERVDMGAVELFASVGRPLASGLEVKVEGFGDARIAPAIPSYAFAGTPIVVYGDTSGAGEGRLVFEWEAGGAKRSLAVPLKIAAAGDGETLRLLQGARLITDVESRYPAVSDFHPAAEGRHEGERVKKRLLALSEAYKLASREMGLVAVVERVGDQPGDIPVTKVVPVGLAQDVEMGAYFGANKLMSLSEPPAILADANLRMYIPATEKAVKMHKAMCAVIEDSGCEDDALVDLAASLEPDGGMPGTSEEERVQATILALLTFVAAGHSAKRGAFRAHVKRMVKFLERSAIRNDVVKEIVERAKAGRPLTGDWTKGKPGPDFWAELEKAIAKAKAA